MHKLFIRFAAAGFVLCAGLVSCSKENKSTDVYRTQLPVIRSSQGSQDLKTWDLLKNKELDLFDELDFSANSPAKMLIRSSCRAATENFYGRGEFSGVSDFRIWETLPSEALTAPLSKKQFACGFEINLYNGVGSNHVYTLAPVPIVERSTSNAQIGMDSRAALPPRLAYGQLQDVRLRFKNSLQAAAKLICEDVELAPLPFEQVIDLAHFNFLAPAPRADHAPEVLQSRPVQNCRGLILERGKAVGLSNLVAIMMPRPKPVILTELLPASPGAPAKFLEDIFRGLPLILQSWQLLNPGPGSRIFRISRGPLKMTMWRLIDDPHFPIKKMYYDYLGYRTAVNGGSPHDGSDASTVTLESGRSVQVQAVLQASAPSHCWELKSVALRIESLAPVLVEELDGDGNVLETTPLQPKSRTLGDTGRAPEQFQEIPACAWWY